MAIIRYEALRILAECIAETVPELRGRICAGPAESPKQLQFPSLAIIPVRFRFFPDQAAEIDELTGRIVTGIPPKSALLNVGRFEGTVQLRLGAQTTFRRATLEEKILQVFLSRPGSPGVLVTPVPKCHDAIVAWELDTDEWQNESAFDKKWYSIMAVAAQLPALVTRGSVPTIEDLRITLTEDLLTPITDIPSDEQETVKVLADGSIESAAGP